MTGIPSSLYLVVRAAGGLPKAADLTPACIKTAAADAPHAACCCQPSGAGAPLPEMHPALPDDGTHPPPA